MNPMPMLGTLCHRLDSVLLQPSVTLSLSSYDKRTGLQSPCKSLSLSAGITLLRALLLAAGLLAGLYTLLALFRAKERRKLRRAMKKGRKRG